MTSEREGGACAELSVSRRLLLGWCVLRCERGPNSKLNQFLGLGSISKANEGSHEYALQWVVFLKKGITGRRSFPSPSFHQTSLPLHPSLYPKPRIVRPHILHMWNLKSALVLFTVLKNRREKSPR